MAATIYGPVCGRALSTKVNKAPPIQNFCHLCDCDPTFLSENTVVSYACNAEHFHLI